jgi:hypothetical protein
MTSSPAYVVIKAANEFALYPEHPEPLFWRERIGATSDEPWPILSIVCRWWRNSPNERLIRPLISKRDSPQAMISSPAVKVLLVSQATQ